MCVCVCVCVCVCFGWGGERGLEGSSGRAVTDVYCTDFLQVCMCALQ